MLLIVTTFQNLSQSSFLCDKWLTDESLLKHILQQYSFDDIGGLTEYQLGRLWRSSTPAWNLRLMTVGSFECCTLHPLFLYQRQASQQCCNSITSQSLAGEQMPPLLTAESLLGLPTQ